MSDAYLRRGVAVSFGCQTVAIAHPCWRLEVPPAFVEKSPGLLAFLSGHAPIGGVRDGSAETRALLRLLELQGCLRAPDKPVYKLREIHELLLPIFNSWYARYYAHPLWDRLRNGQLSRNGLCAWLIHNFHLSRSAGISDARSATELDSRERRALFMASLLEEWSHFDEYFQIRHPGMHLDEFDLSECVRLAGSLAFDQQMLRMGRGDGLGHIIVSLWQESSVRFREQTRAFQASVEANYGLPGYFQDWDRHIGLDVEYSHASRFAAALDRDATVTKHSMLASLRGAWFTFEHLVAALDQVLAEDANGAQTPLRHPVKDGWVDADRSSLFSARRNKARIPAQLTGASALDVHVSLGEIGMWERPNRPTVAAGDAAFLLADVGATFMRALGHSEFDTSAIRLFGRLATDALHLANDRGSDPVGDASLPQSPEGMAIANFLREASVDPALLASLVFHLYPVPGSGSWLPVTRASMDLCRSYLEHRSLLQSNVDTLTTRLVQLEELLERWLSLSDGRRVPDFLND